MVRDDDGGRVHVYRGGADGEVLFHGGPVLDNPSLHLLLAGNWAEQEQPEAVKAARELEVDGHARSLERYGVRTLGIRRVAAQTLSMKGGETTDLDVQRALAEAVESGRIQHVDPNIVYVVMLDSSIQPTVGGTSDWLSYHSQFHPTELPMRYVVVRGGLDASTQQNALRVSFERALMNPDGDGWY
jgi:hypothetical protein